MSDFEIKNLDTLQAFLRLPAEKYRLIQSVHFVNIHDWLPALDTDTFNALESVLIKSERVNFINVEFIKYLGTTMNENFDLIPIHQSEMLIDRVPLPQFKMFMNILTKSHATQFCLRDIELNKLSMDQFQLLRDTWLQWKKLIAIRLQRCSLHALDETLFEILCNTLVQCNLEILGLSGENLDELTPNQFRILMNALPQCNILYDISLYNTNLDKLDMVRFQTLCDTLTQCKKLTDIDVEYNKLNKLGTVRFQALCNTFRQFERIAIHHFDLSGLDNTCFEMLRKGLQKCKYCLGGFNSLTPEQQTILDDILQKNHNPCYVASHEKTATSSTTANTSTSMIDLQKTIESQQKTIWSQQQQIAALQAKLELVTTQLKKWEEKQRVERTNSSALDANANQPMVPMYQAQAANSIVATSDIQKNTLTRANTIQ